METFATPLTTTPATRETQRTDARATFRQVAAAARAQFCAAFLHAYSERLSPPSRLPDAHWLPASFVD